MSKFKEAGIKANEFIMEGLKEAQGIKNEIGNALAKRKKKLTIAGYGIFGLVLTLMFSLGFAEVILADEPGGQVFERANTAMQGVLRQIRIISSIVAALFLTLAFLLKMLSKNQRTVDEANTWIKRIAIAWACINAVGFILTFIQDVIGTDVDLPTLGS
jgi:hypothetical protein